MTYAIPVHDYLEANGGPVCEHLEPGQADLFDIDPGAGPKEYIST